MDIDFLLKFDWKWICLFCLAVVNTGNCQTSGRLVTRVVSTEVHYCGEATDIAFAQVRITVVLQNKANRNVILLRQLESPSQLYAKDSSGKEALHLDLGHTYLSREDLITMGSDPDETIFEILPAGKYTKRNIDIQLPVSRDREHLAAGTLIPGTYTILATVPTKPPFAGDQAHILKMLTAWKRVGIVALKEFDLKFTLTLSLPAHMNPC